MTKLLACLLFAAAVVAANPFLETYLSEVSVNSAHQFVELHCAPQPTPADMHGWRILTSLSACTLACQLQQDSFLVVDSEALAFGEIGHGSLRLNPARDSIILLNATGLVEDQVHFPMTPTGYDSAPLPPATGSIAFWNYDDVEGQSMNWYADSTATPGWENDDYGSIAGTVTGTNRDTLDEVYVTARGQKGQCHCGLYHQTGYNIGGLGAGKYEVKAYAYHQGQPYQVTYPESVSVGYSEVVSEIDIVIPTSGVTEARSGALQLLLRVSGRALLLSGDGTTPVVLQLFNQVGARVSEYDLGPIRGGKRIELPATLTPGVYFATAQRGTSRTTTKVVFW